MSVTVTHRKTCRLCDSPHVELVVALEPIPLSESYANSPSAGANEARYPVDLYMCTNCTHVQQLDVVDAKSLWANYTYYSGDAKGMPEHFQSVASETIATYQPPQGGLVVDIGSNDGSLLRPFKDAGYRVLGVDPAIAIAQMATDSGIETIPELMSLELAKEIRSRHGGADLVFMFNAFAHADDLGEVVDSIHTLLAPGGVFIFEAQYLLDIIDGMLIATIFHEHISHHSVKALTGFFDRHGLELIHVERVPIQHGSLIGTVQLKGGKRQADPSVAKLLALEESRALGELSTLKQFASRIHAHRDCMIRFVQEWKAKGAVIAGYGAARSGPTLIAQMGLSNCIEYIFDDHPQKVHKFSPGDGIEIVPTAELCRRMPDYTVILAWVHSAKIVAANQDYLKKGGRFVILCPEMRVVEFERETLLS